MAEFLFTLADAFDYPQLTEDVLKDISSKEFSSTDLKGPKSISTFLIKISELTPHLVIRQMTLLVNLLDSEVPYFRLVLEQPCTNNFPVVYPSMRDYRSMRELDCYA
jgi:condensin complex subunit 1